MEAALRDREMAAVKDKKREEEALERLRAADLPLYLSPSPELSQHACAVASHLFSAFLPFCPKSPVDRLLANEGFDAEQIWYQIDLLSTMRREVRRLEWEPPKVLLPAQGKAEAMKKGEDGEEGEQEDDDDGEKDEEEDTAVSEEEEREEKEEEGEGKGQGVEDHFLKIKELKEYLKKNEEEEYGQSVRRKRKEKKDEEEEEEEDGEEEVDEDDGEDADEADLEVRCLCDNC